MNIPQSDTIDGRDSARQFGLQVFYLFATCAIFALVTIIIFFLTMLGFGGEAAKSFLEWSLPLSFLITMFILGAMNGNCWVNPSGNKVLPTIDIFNPRTLTGGGTRFIVYTAGFALTWPWERRVGEEIDIEREKFHPQPLFKINVEKTSLEVEMKIAWRPHSVHLSSFLQNAGEDNTSILNQIGAKAQQLTEEFAAEYTKAETVRATQSTLALAVQNELQPFASHLGIEIFDISYSKFDYSPDTQKRLDKLMETTVVTEILEKLLDADVEPSKASEMAAVLAGVEGVKINRNIWEVVAEESVVQAIGALGPVAQKWLQDKTTQQTNPQKKP